MRVPRRSCDGSNHAQGDGPFHITIKLSEPEKTIMTPPPPDQPGPVPPRSDGPETGGTPTSTPPPQPSFNSELQREVAILRLLFQMNARLRLETLAALSRVFREHGVQITDRLLSSLVFAITDELPGESSSPLAEISNRSGAGTFNSGRQQTPGSAAQSTGNPPPQPSGSQPGQPTGNPPTQPTGNPPPQPTGNPPGQPPTGTPPGRPK